MKHPCKHSCHAPSNSKLELPPTWAAPWGVFELLKFCLFKYSPLGSKCCSNPYPSTKFDDQRPFHQNKCIHIWIVENWFIYIRWVIPEYIHTLTLVTFTFLTPLPLEIPKCSTTPPPSPSPLSLQSFPCTSIFFSPKLFLEQFTAGSLYRQMYGKFKTRLDAFWQSYISPIFFLKILFLVPKVSNS